ncbi:hypothetical protein LX87_00847 [Larkinella arboricola]|uniref:pPIWI-RE three-gene island domain-containing protein n=1 Tax=Larkinella arboricola TaxID=643671 RepID=A0A327X6X0_LARAB|nr:hypothetical protein [Larkinella arboricola]RAK02727.1 hypothetical protein LX87_00847 [Larkinella arboricola]
MNALFSSPQTAVTPGRRSVRLSARQLLDVELGLFLISQLRPDASPNALPDLLSQVNPGWTTRQHKLRNRGLALLAHLTQYSRWHHLLESYMAAPVELQAYDISRDRSRFGPKTVGFSRNRLTVLRKVLS